MIPMTVNQVTPGLVSLFDLTKPTAIRAKAVLKGGNAGKIFSDGHNNPQWAFVWEADDGTLYRGGKYGRRELEEVVALLRQEAVVALGFRDGDPDVELFPPEPDAGAECLEFDRPLGCSDLSTFLGPLPIGYTLHRMDRVLLECSPRHDETLNRFGNIQNFLDFGIAVCIRHGEKIVCEAFADMEVEGFREMGIRTDEAYRRKGLATIACAHLITLCEREGCCLYWDCARLNAGSVSLAHKLGFQNERAYKLLAWFKKSE